MPWGRLKPIIKELLPETVLDKDQEAYGRIPGVLTALFGERDKGWRTERRNNVLFVFPETEQGEDVES